MCYDGHNMITVTEIEKLAVLSRIELDQASKEALAKDVGAILAYVDQIKDAGVTAEPGFSHAAVKNVLRQDENAHESGAHTEKMLSSAPRRQGDYVKVKQIISQD
jgi:aspartyl/glutamyl-tRNA(Asn/Gln) amidotransferase C subunit